MNANFHYPASYSNDSSETVSLLRQILGYVRSVDERMTRIENHLFGVGQQPQPEPHLRPNAQPTPGKRFSLPPGAPRLPEGGGLFPQPHQDGKKMTISLAHIKDLFLRDVCCLGDPTGSALYNRIHELAKQ